MADSTQARVPASPTSSNIAPRLDGCPECVVNTELPYAINPTATGHIAAYGCTDCGHFWTTSWED